jgi:hypothetical protein
MSGCESAGKESGDVPLFRRRSTTGELLGTWRQEDSEEEMEFLGNGEMRYRTPTAADKVGVMFLTYRVEGDVIISDQRSHPHEERTRYALRNGRLYLTGPDGTESTWTRG